MQPKIFYTLFNLIWSRLHLTFWSFCFDTFFNKSRPLGEGLHGLPRCSLHRNDTSSGWCKRCCVAIQSVVGDVAKRNLGDDCFERKGDVLVHAVSNIHVNVNLEVGTRTPYFPKSLDLD